MQPSADPKIGDIANPHSDVNQLASFKFADEGSADSGHLAHPHFDNAKVPVTVMSDEVLYRITKHAMRRSADEIGATSISFWPKVFSDPASVVD